MFNVTFWGFMQYNCNPGHGFRRHIFSLWRSTFCIIQKSFTQNCMLRWIKMWKFLKIKGNWYPGGQSRQNSPSAIQPHERPQRNSKATHAAAWGACQGMRGSCSAHVAAGNVFEEFGNTSGSYKWHTKMRKMKLDWIMCCSTLAVSHRS